MVVKRRLLLATLLGLTLSLAVSAGPALGAFSAARPDPLSTNETIHVQDIAVVSRNAGVGPVVALGWRERANPGTLYFTYSTNGGRSYRRPDGTFRRFPVLGEGNRGMSVDVCGGRVWAASLSPYPGDDDGDRDVVLASRSLDGTPPGQAFMTNPGADRSARHVSLACVGNRLLAVAWLEILDGKPRAALMLRSLEPLGETPALRRVFGLGPAIPKGGISVDAKTDAVHVAWTANAGADLFYKGFTVGKGADPRVVRGTTKRLARGDARFPQIAVRGQRVLLAYSDAGQVRARLSADGGASFEPPDILVRVGSVARPSRAYSADISGQRVIVEVVAATRDEPTPRRIESKDAGDSWDARSFGHNGARIGALHRTSPTKSLLVEAWQNNAPGTDTLRAQYEH